MASLFNLFSVFTHTVLELFYISFISVFLEGIKNTGTYGCLQSFSRLLVLKAHELGCLMSQALKYELGKIKHGFK